MRRSTFLGVSQVWLWLCLLAIGASPAWGAKPKKGQKDCRSVCSKKMLACTKPCAKNEQPRTLRQMDMKCMEKCMPEFKECTDKCKEEETKAP